jgi:hypothetical protein
LTWIATLLLSGTIAACGGAGPLKDGAGMSAEMPDDAGAASDDGGSSQSIVDPPIGCWRVEQGCQCQNPGEVVACQAPVYRNGDYATCAGTRECINGTWGPCWPTNYQVAGTTSRHR